VKNDDEEKKKKMHVDQYHFMVYGMVHGRCKNHTLAINFRESFQTI